MSTLKYRDQIQIDPLGYAAALAEELGGAVAIHEQSRVEEIEYGDPCRLTVNGRTVTAHHVVVATQMPMIGDGFFFTKAYPFAHPMAAAPLPARAGIDGMFISAGSPSRSFRTAGRDGTTYLVAAGREYTPGEEAKQAEAVQELLAFLRDSFGIEEPSHLWTSEDFRPMDGAAFIGPATSSRPNLLIATGFEAWGLSQGVVAGEVIAGHILGRPHPAAELFEASRLKPLSGGGTFVTENVKAGAHLVGDRLLGRHVVALDSIAPGGGGVVRSGGKQHAVIRDHDGTVRSMSAVCTHMGCIVGWNDVDRTFDCPCHGSRFDENGEVLCGPAVSPLASSELKDNS